MIYIICIIYLLLYEFEILVSNYYIIINNLKKIDKISILFILFLVLKKIFF